MVSTLCGGAWHWWLVGSCWLIAYAWAWWLVYKAGLGCHDDVQSNVVCKAWASGCWLSAWIDASRLMGNYIVYVLYVGMLCGLCWLIGESLGMGQASQNMWRHVVWVAGWWAEAPWFAETWVVHLQWQLPKQFLVFLMFRPTV